MERMTREEAAALSDDGLQQEIAGIKRQKKSRGRGGMVLFGLGLVLTIAATGWLGATMGMMLAGDATSAIFCGLFMGSFGACLVAQTTESAVRGRDTKYTWLMENISAEVRSRRAARAAEEARLQTPLESKATEAFIASLSDGVKDNVAVGKPLRFKSRPLTSDTPGRILR